MDKGLKQFDKVYTAEDVIGLSIECKDGKCECDNPLDDEK